MLEAVKNACDLSVVTPRISHPIPYQGSKRNLAPQILAIVGGRRARRLYEPFVGSAAVTLAAARAGLAADFVIGDTLRPLIDVWRSIIGDPVKLASGYARVWEGQQMGDDSYYTSVRDRFNNDGDPASLLYLLARCVKNSPRWNQKGLFNQSADKRRLGMHPDKMRREILGAHHLLRNRTETFAGDFERLVEQAGPDDLVYLDPPWQGTSESRDRRYHQGLARERLITVLDDLNRRGVPWLLSYDGRCGEKTYGDALPSELGTRIELQAGRSSQATLNGLEAMTVESLYVSPAVRSVRHPRQQLMLSSLAG